MVMAETTELGRWYSVADAMVMQREEGEWKRRGSVVEEEGQKRRKRLGSERAAAAEDVGCAGEWGWGEELAAQTSTFLARYPGEEGMDRGRARQSLGESLWS
jgi:hypothetical protein